MSREAVSKMVATTLYQTFQGHGYFWNDGPGQPEQNASLCLTHLIHHMPRSDLILLFTKSHDFVEFMFEHIRLSLQTRAFGLQLGVTWDDFIDYVLPYAIINEKRDLKFRWRQRFMQIFFSSTEKSTTLTQAVQTLVNLVPKAQPLGLFSLSDSQHFQPVPGPPITWVSESSPGYMSPQQVAQHGGSCTGTGIVLVAACRSVGVPARLAGCSESIVRGDDHHWIEFLDYKDAGPFGDFWHTKEGVSLGNEGGPWDQPSPPMVGCLNGVVPHSQLDTIWATKWSSSVNLPTLWSNSSWFETWSRVGGENRCGRYCTSWGCGVNQSQHWDQRQCAP